MASFDNCSPETVMGDLLASEMAKGKEIPLEIASSIGGNGMAAMAQKASALNASIYDSIPKSLTKIMHDDGLDWLNESLIQSYRDDKGNIWRQQRLKSLGLELAKPSTILGDGIVDSIDEVANDLAKQGIYNGPKYKSAIQRAFRKIDTDALSPEQKIYFVRWRDSIKDTSLPASSGDSAIVSGIDAITKGTVTLSPTVTLGNMVEVMMKGLPLYRENFFKGISNLVSEHGFEGLYKEIPEVKKNGLYGLDIGERAPEGKLQEIASLFDRPSKNIMYYVGKTVDGSEQSGRKAVQRTLFLPRLGDTPLVYKNATAKATLRLANYTIGTINLFHDVISAAYKNPNPANAASAGLLLGAYGGVLGIPAYMTSQGQNVGEIPYIGPLWKVAAATSSVNPVVRFGIAPAIFNRRVIEPLTKLANPSELKARDIWQIATALGVIATQGNGMIGELATNRLFNTVIGDTLDAISGESDLGQSLMELVPGYKE